MHLNPLQYLERQPPRLVMAAKSELSFELPVIDERPDVILAEPAEELRPICLALQPRELRTLIFGLHRLHEPHNHREA